jgi:Family of unknown function (DUF6526)
MHDMPNDTAQSLKNHTRLVPGFHLVALPLIMINLIWSLVSLVRHPEAATVKDLVVAIILMLVALFARQFAVTVQDRVIRLEMRLRIRELCPPDLAGRFREFTPGQLVALRFAGDGELAALARKVLDEKLEDRKAIKALVKDWQADTLRA